MRSAPNKAKYFEYANSGYFHWIILLRAYILVDPNNRLLSLADDSRCLYIQYIVLLDDVACQVYVQYLLIMENEIIRGCRDRRTFSLHGTRFWRTFFLRTFFLHAFLAQVSAVSVHTIYISEC